MAVNKHIQLFRNLTPSNTKEEAIAKLDEFATNKTIEDGAPVLARYKEGAEVKTLLAIFHTTSEKSSYTLLSDGSAGSVAELELNELKAKLGNGFSATETVAKVIAALKGDTTNDTKDSESVVGAKKYADNAVSELKGAATKTVKELEDELTTLNGDDSTVGSVDKKIKDATTGMTLAAVAEEGSIITSVAQENGKVAAVKTPIKDVKLKGYTKGTETGAIAEEDTLVQALSKIENNAANATVSIKSDDKILSKDSNNALFASVTLSAVTPTDTAVREEYTIVGKGGADLAEGKHIKVYKDSSLKSLELVAENDTHQAGQFLKYVYVDVNGDDQTVYVDCSTLLAQSEFKNGLQVNTAGEVSVKLATDSEEYLTVDENGIKLSGVKTAIENAKKNAAVIVSADTNQHVSVVESAGADGGKVFTVSDNVAGDNVKMKGFTADAKGFTGITENSTVSQAVKNIEEEILKNEEVVAASLNDLKDTKLDKILLNETEVSVTKNPDKISTAKLVIDGSTITLKNYAAVTAAEPAEGDTINAAIAKLYASIGSNSSSVKAGDGIKVATDDPSKVSVKAADAITEENIANFGFAADGTLILKKIDGGTY
nr:MAG TPA: hypothetical protein [Caudoviricetes sp.]